MTETAKRTAFDELAARAASIDPIDLAGRIIADPRRVRVSLAGELAMAMALEQFWAVCIEAHVLVRALALPDTRDDGSPDLARAAAISAQADTIRKQIAAMRGQEE